MESERTGPLLRTGFAPAAAAAAKSLQSCPTPCNPRDGSPWGSPIPGIPQARTLEWGAIAFPNAWKWKVKVKSLSHVRLLRTDVKAETPILWPPHAKSWLIGKDHDAGRDWGQEEKGTTEDEMAGWHHRLYGHEFEWTLGVGDGQGGLACCNSWGRKESDTTEQLNWTELNCGLLIPDMWKGPKLLSSSLWPVPHLSKNLPFPWAKVEFMETI